MEGVPPISNGLPLMTKRPLEREARRGVASHPVATVPRRRFLPSPTGRRLAGRAAARAIAEGNATGDRSIPASPPRRRFAARCGRGDLLLRSIETNARRAVTKRFGRSIIDRSAVEINIERIEGANGDLPSRTASPPTERTTTR
jgi:hypothetical protein